MTDVENLILGGTNESFCKLFSVLFFINRSFHLIQVYFNKTEDAMYTDNTADLFESNIPLCFTHAILIQYQQH
jgi:hypothetical protein